MRFWTRIIYWIIGICAELSAGIRAWFGASTVTLCDIETALSPDDHILIMADGSCTSLIRWNGSRRMIGAEEFDAAVTAFERQLSSMMNRPGHSIQVVFGCDRDPELGSAVLDDLFAPMYRTAERLQLALKDVLDDRKRAMAKHCAPEYCYVALTTRTTVMTPVERAEAEKKRREDAKGLPMGPSAQNYARGIQVVIDTHRAFVDFFKRDLRTAQMDAGVLNARDALRVIRSLIDPDFTAHDWAARLPGDPLPTREHPLLREDDPSYLLWPCLHEQLIPREPGQLDFKTLKIGERIWRPLVVTVQQATPQPFQDLFSRMRASNAPWRLSITISGDGLPENEFNSSSAGMLTLGNRANVHIHETFKDLKDQRARGQAIVGCRMMGATWAPEGQTRQLAENASRFARALQSWGGCEVHEATGAPVAGVFSTIPGLRLTSIVPVTNAPLRAALALLPWGRPASPWKEGNFLFRTPDGKPFPYAAYSSQQDAWVGLITAPMGGGKSVILNGLNLGLVLDATNEDLPLIRILDIGPSSSGFTSLVSSALPPSQAYRSQYHRIRNTHEYSMNPCDTPLGQRYPLAAHREYLIGMLCLLATPLDAAAPADGIAAIAQIVVDAAYQRLADEPTSAPRAYARGASPYADAAIERHGLQTDTNTTWWEVVDAMMDVGDHKAAYAAHRMAMPLIADFAGFAMEDGIVKMYPDEVVANLSLPQFFRRKILEATQQYRILQRPTQLDFGDAPIVSLDLDEVAKRGSASALRQTTVMYLLGLWFLTSDFFIGEESLASVGPRYRAYHAARIQRLRRSKKRICADEFHRPSESSPMAVEVFQIIVREGRKWNTETMLVSQRAEDFPATLVDLATCIIIMKPPQTGAESVRDRFRYSNTDVFAINTSLNGPVPGVGANCHVRWLTKDGEVSHLLTNTTGAIELWGLSTTAEDRDLRDLLYKKMPHDQARMVLAEAYPSGVKVEVAARSEIRARTGITSARPVVDEIADEILARMSARAASAGLNRNMASAS